MDLIGDMKLSLRNMRPDILMHNPVMFITEISMIITIFIAIFPSYFSVPDSMTYRNFYIAVIILLLLTVYFSSLSTAISEKARQ